MSAAHKINQARFSRTHNGTSYTIEQTTEGWECSNGYVYGSLTAASIDIAGVRSGPAWWSAQTAKAPKRKPAQAVQRKGKGMAANVDKPAATPVATAKLASNERPSAATVSRKAISVAEAMEIVRVQQDIANQAKEHLRNLLEAQLALLK